MSTQTTRLRIRFYGDPRLRLKARPVGSVTARDREILEEMAELMRISGGIGLAAPQVGISKQMIIVDIGQGLIRLINPKIIKRSGSEVREEGCLSLPGAYVSVRRSRSIIVTGLNEDNQEVRMSVTDLLARAIQHEMDHLKGKLIIDYASLWKRMQLKRKLKVFVKEISHDGMCA